jgi:hypothetical protein
MKEDGTSILQAVKTCTVICKRWTKKFWVNTTWCQ